MTDPSSTPPASGPFYNRLLLRVLLFGAIGFVVWFLIGLLVDGSVFDNPFWGVVVGIFAGVISTGVSRRR